MKKTISVLLMLVIVLSLCACGNANSGSVNNGSVNNENSAKKNNSKYVGTYVFYGGWETPTTPTEERLILEQDGTGTYSEFTTEYRNEIYPKGFVLEDGTISWSVDENGYITIVKNGNRYYTKREGYIEEGTPWTTLETCELKGTQLFVVGQEGGAKYTKVS